MKAVLLAWRRRDPLDAANDAAALAAAMSDRAALVPGASLAHTGSAC